MGSSLTVGFTMGSSISMSSLVTLVANGSGRVRAERTLPLLGRGWVEPCRSWIGERHQLRVGTDGDDGYLLTALPSPTTLLRQSRYRREGSNIPLALTRRCVGGSGLGSPLFRSQTPACPPSWRPPSHRGHTLRLRDIKPVDPYLFMLPAADLVELLAFLHHA